MTNYIDQTIARELVKDRIRGAEAARLRREVRRARRTGRAAARSASAPSADKPSDRMRWERWLALAVAR